MRFVGDLALILQIDLLEAQDLVGDELPEEFELALDQVVGQVEQDCARYELVLHPLDEVEGVHLHLALRLEPAQFLAILTKPARSCSSCT